MYVSLTRMKNYKVGFICNHPPTFFFVESVSCMLVIEKSNVMIAAQLKTSIKNINNIVLPPSPISNHSLTGHGF